jgi:hypothetical protein
LRERKIHDLFLIREMAQSVSKTQTMKPSSIENKNYYFWLSNALMAANH